MSTGSGKGLRTPPARRAHRRPYTAEAHGRAFGFHRGADHFGAVLGSFAAWALLAPGAAVRDVIAWSVVPGLLAFWCSHGGGVQTAGRRRGRRRIGGTGRDGAPRTTGRRFWPPILALAALTFFRLPETLLLLRLQDRGVPIAAVPLVWAGLHVVRSFSSYPGGWLSDRVGPRRVVAAGGLLFAARRLCARRGRRAGAAIAVFMVLGTGRRVDGRARTSGCGASGAGAPRSRVRAYHAFTGCCGAAGGDRVRACCTSRSRGRRAARVDGRMVAAVALWIVSSGAAWRRPNG